MTVYKSQGTILRIGDGADPENFAVCAHIVGISGISSGAPTEIDTMELIHTHKAVIMGLPDEGEANISLFYDPGASSHNTLRGLFDNQQLNNFEIVLTDSSPTTLSFSAYVKTYDINIQPDDKVTLDVTLRVQGLIAYS